MEKRPPTSARSAFDRPTVLIAALYSAAWGLMLLNGGRYWDDWTLVRLSRQGAHLMAAMAGQWWQEYVYLAMSWVPGMEYVLHAATFLLFLGTALLLYRILRRIPGIDPAAPAAIALVFALFPVNASRIVAMNFQYTISLAVFYLAWFLIAVDLERPSLARRISAGILFLLAMNTTNSLLVFIALVPLYVVLAARRRLRDGAERRALLARYSFLVALPVLSWVVRSAVLYPWGIYERYNALGTEGFAKFPDAVAGSILGPLAAALPWLLLAVPAFFVLRRRSEPAAAPAAAQHAAILGFGVLAFVLGVVPYLAVGKVPQPVGWDWWDSRHQLLVPLGAALVVYGAAMLLARAVRLPRAAGLAVVAALAVSFTVADAGTVLAYQVDWYKQVAFMKHAAADGNFRGGDYFVVRDEAADLNVQHRRYLPYEYSGMMFMIFGDETRFGVDAEYKSDYDAQLMRYIGDEQYHWRQWRQPPGFVDVTVRRGKRDLRDLRPLLGLMVRERFIPRQFDADVREVIDVETKARP